MYLIYALIYAIKLKSSWTEGGKKIVNRDSLEKSDYFYSILLYVAFCFVGFSNSVCNYSVVYSKNWVAFGFTFSLSIVALPMVNALQTVKCTALDR